VVFVTGLAAEPTTGSRTRAFHTIRALCDLGCRVHNAYLIQKAMATPQLDALARLSGRFTHSSTVKVISTIQESSGFPIFGRSRHWKLDWTALND